MEEERPLWLPAGSVRAIIALSTVGAMIALLAMSGNVPEWFIAVVGSVIGFYFAKKEVE